MSTIKMKSKRARRAHVGAPATEDERIAEALAPAKRDVADFATRRSLKVAPQKWRNNRGQIVFIAQIGDAEWAPCLRDEQRRAIPYFARSVYMPSLDFEHAQERLDIYAARKGWTSLDPEAIDDAAEEAVAAAEQARPARRGRKGGRKAEGGGERAEERGERAEGGGRNGNGRGMFARGPAGGAAEQVRELPIDQVGPSPFNPREDFHKAELLELAESIRTSGVVQPVIVRPAPAGEDARYELVAGERRWKAACLAGRATLPAIVRDLDDAQARRDCLAENLNRRDLSAVEKAHGLKAMLDAEPGLTQKALGERFGLEQGTVSNLLRLLEAPADWQAKVISGEITERHVRAALPYREHPALMQALAEEIEYRRKRTGSYPAEDFERAVRYKVLDATKPMTGEHWNAKLGRSVKVFKPTDEERARLGIVTVKDYRGKPEERATNVTLYNKLQGEYVARQLAKSKKQADAGAGAKTPAGKSKKPTPAQARQKAADEAEAYRAWLCRTILDAQAHFLREFFLGRLDERPTEPQVLRALVTCVMGDADVCYGLGRAVLRARKVKCEYDREPEAVARMGDEEMAALGCETLALVCVGSDGEPCQNESVVRALFRSMALDLDGLFRFHQLGQMSEAYWRGPERMPTEKAKARLLDLARETKLTGLSADQDLDAMVKAALKNCPGPDAKEAGPVCPKEIKKCKLGR